MSTQAFVSNPRLRTFRFRGILLAVALAFVPATAILAQSSPPQASQRTQDASRQGSDQDASNDQATGSQSATAKTDPTRVKSDEAAKPGKRDDRKDPERELEEEEDI